MAVTSLVPYQDFCRKYVPEQYKQSPKLLGLIDACLAQCDDLETAFFELMDALNLETTIGPALDYIGAIAGVVRIPGETDDHYRERIKNWRRISGLPGLEALRAVLLFVSGCDRVGLYPDWPAGMYFVLNGSTPADLSDVERYMTSGCNLTRGTFLMGEYEGEDEVEFGYLVLEDNGQPIVCDYRYQNTEYVMVDMDGNGIINDQGEVVVGIDYLT